MNFKTRLNNYTLPRPGHPDGLPLTPRKRRRLLKKDNQQWARAQANETTRDHR